ncbi:MAG: hypothetical protein MJE66_13005 [Proteobacteria bacterium]|nr:hypothetical protein [Pseudomonadota bacterium]
MSRNARISIGAVLVVVAAVMGAAAWAGTPANPGALTVVAGACGVAGLLLLVSGLQADPEGGVHTPFEITLYGTLHSPTFWLGLAVVVGGQVWGGEEPSLWSRGVSLSGLFLALHAIRRAAAANVAEFESPSSRSD